MYSSLIAGLCIANTLINHFGPDFIFAHTIEQFLPVTTLTTVIPALSLVVEIGL